MDQIIVVDYLDREIGFGEKIAVHQEGLLHRAFSVFLLDGDRVLLQKRNADKYHSGGKIANSCCSHPRVGEQLIEAATRRVAEELGITAPPMQEIGHIVYRADFGNGIIEYEYDHILIGEYSGDISPNPEEIESAFWVDLADLQADILSNPQNYAVWFISALTIVLDFLKNNH